MFAGTWASRAMAESPTMPVIYRMRFTWMSTATSPPGAVQAAIRCPSRPSSRSAWLERESAMGTSWSRTTTSVAARLWWMLDNLGHAGVAVLDGGLPAWTALGLPVSRDEPEFEPAELHLAGRWSRIVDRGELLGLLRGQRRPTVLDARAGPRYRGEVEPIDPVAGHIPTARNAPTAGNLGRDGRFLPAAELRERYVELGADARDVVTSCGSGVSACHISLAMRIAGLPDPILYPGSWSDWSTAGYPVATGPEPGSPPA
jgi:thiosulfate/3-mercaptopyruvate sulfurtransferase